MKNSSIYIIGVILALNLGGCKSSKNDISKKIGVMKGTQVSIPYDKMLYWSNGAMLDEYLNMPDGMKLVVFIDSTNCSDCELKKIHLWNDFVKMEEKYKHRFQVSFIVESNAKNSVKAIQHSYNHCKLEHPILIDSANVFSSKNPHIPLEQMFHVFLLDENNNVVLVGNPLFNQKIEEMLLAILEEKLGKGL